MSVETRWFVIHTYSGYEKKVKGNIEKVVENRSLQDRIFDTKIPVETVTEIQGDKKKEVERMLFPGYVLVKVAVERDEDDRPVMDDDTYLAIRHIRGVTGFLGPDNKAIPLTEDEVYKLGVEKRTVEVNYAVGDTVSIIDDMFDGFTGTVKEIDVENERVRVSVSAFFGKETMVDLGFDQVESLED